MPIASERGPHISRDEIRARQDRVREACRERGWPGLVVFGRGGGTYDRHGDLLYLTGHYQSFVHLPDRPPLWSARSHALLVLPVDREATLICSAPDVDGAVAVDDIRVTANLAAEAAPLLRRCAGGGLAGADIVPYALARELPLGELVAADALLDSLRRRKSQAEQQLLRHVCAIGSRAATALMTAAVPGATEGEAVAAAAEVAYAEGAVVYLPVLSSADRVASYTGRPLPGYRHERRFAAGDLTRLDLVIVYEGYYCDFGRSWVVGGNDQATGARALIGAVRDGLDAALAATRAGATAGEVARAGTAAVPPGFSPSYPPHWGHGLGLGWEGPMLLSDSEEVIEEGTALAVEVTVQSADGRAASGEEDVIVREDGVEILSSAPWSVS